MINNPHTHDPILDELHAIRRQMNEDYGGDLSRMAVEMRKRELNSNHPIAPIPVSSIHKSNQDAEQSGVHHDPAVHE